MKSLIKALAIAFALGAPVVSFAQQSQQSLTRAEVRAQTIQAKQSGYSPLDWADFPDGEIQAAQFRKSLRDARSRDGAGYGSGQSGNSQSGDIAR
ncbi:uncharacterized protein DUF4148 [Paraburkholderia sp. BL27I4N3]|uniref:DUF4148 domain-containing protein n=1 Tax=Paraburkholderia sp. BL27I4N3 TaxID=1938805 RepID=UPI000E24AEA2|nr:DUF4148 domain-containing protein [Paraburkholderia sp. BL27I4N3]REE21474.1 uncharacterized protein DUF4148 [Paraburkholderia sp. BL27I4N3]